MAAPEECQWCGAGIDPDVCQPDGDEVTYYCGSYWSADEEWGLAGGACDTIVGLRDQVKDLQMAMQWFCDRVDKGEYAASEPTPDSRTF